MIVERCAACGDRMRASQVVHDVVCPALRPAVAVRQLTARSAVAVRPPKPTVTRRPRAAQGKDSQPSYDVSRADVPGMVLRERRALLAHLRPALESSGRCLALAAEAAASGDLESVAFLLATVRDIAAIALEAA